MLGGMGSTLLRRVEPPPPWEVVRELRAMADSELVAFALGAWVKEGLLALADDYAERGQPSLADWWRSKVRELGEVHIAHIDLVCYISDGLRDLAERYREEGYLLLSMRWGLWSEFVKARGWKRVRIAHGIDH